MVRVSITGSGGDTLDGFGPLERVLVDEATQAREAAVVVPLMRGCKQSMLVGDHCQSPEGHGVPLFSRMVARGVPPYMLDTQDTFVVCCGCSRLIAFFAASYAFSH